MFHLLLGWALFDCTCQYHGTGQCFSPGGELFESRYGGEPTPASDEILNEYAYDVVGYPVQSQPGGELQREDSEHYGHHVQHHAVHLRLAWVGASPCRRGHLLLQPHAYAHQHRKDVDRVRDGKFEPE